MEAEREGRENAGEPCGDGFERGVGEVTFFVNSQSSVSDMPAKVSHR